MPSKLTLATLAASTCIFVVPVAQAQTRYSFDMAAQPLEAALRSVATRTSTNIIFDGPAIRGRTAPALHGEFTAQAAFHALLQGSGLTLNVTQGGSYIVVAPPGQNTVSGESGAISGHLTRDEAGRALAGALVRIVETGQTATADENGDFRFPSVAPGTYTMEISFLGFETRSQTVAVGSGKEASIALALNEGADAGVPIVVYGTRSARANALNIQRAAENNADVVSADDLGNFTGTTFSDALRRAPGVSFQRNSITGDGVNINVRGMAPDMNAIKLNGVQLPVGNGTGRSADLSNLLADSVSRITINKSLLPSQDSAGTGALVEIETMAPLDRPHRYANFQIEGGGRPKGFNSDFLASGTIAARFGAQDNFGLSASVQYRRNSVRNISYNTVTKFGAFLPTVVQGALPTGPDVLDPNASFPFVPGDDKAYVSQLETDFNHVTQTTLAGTLSAQWRIGTSTDLRFDFQHDETKQTSYQFRDIFRSNIEYSDLPGGDAISALHLDLSPDNGSLGREQDYSYDPDGKLRTDTYSFKGKSTFGKFDFNYLLGYAHGSEYHPRSTTLALNMTDTDAQAGYFLPAATDSKLGYIVSPFGVRSGSQLPLPLLSDAGWAFINNPSQFAINDGTGQIDTTTGRNNRYTAKFSTRWNVDAGFLKYIEAGAFFERSTFRSDLVRTQFGGGATISDLGLAFGPTDLGRIGITGSTFSGMSEGTLTHFLDNVNDYVRTYFAGDANNPARSFQLMPIIPNPDQNKQSTSENNYAAYLQARLQFGKLEIIGGVRYNRVDLKALNLYFPTYIGPVPALGGAISSDLDFQNEFTKLVPGSARTADFLPRVLFNYRENDNLIFRGGYYLSVARPQIADLSTQTRLSFINLPIPTPEGVKPILQVSSGNPNLKEAYTDNLDLGAEWYHKIGIVKVNGFYKRTRNLLQGNRVDGPANLANITLPDSIYFKGAPYFDPAHPENYYISGSSPINSNHPATVWGFEGQIIRNFDFLPGALSGLGIYANYTYTHSSLVALYNWAYAPAGGQTAYEFPNVPFNSSPKHSGTAALTYQKYGIDATLSYSFQSRSLANFSPRGLSVYDAPVRTLDFRGDYYFTKKAHVYVEASDLLKGTTDPDVQQLVYGQYISATYLGGRKFKIGVAANF